MASPQPEKVTAEPEKGEAPPTPISATTPPRNIDENARSLVRKLVTEGKKVIVNVGGAGAPHEPQDAINLNNLAIARKGIPNLVEADGAEIGLLFESSSIDGIEGHNMAPGVVNWNRAAPGAYKVLRPGGTFEYYYRDANSDAPVLCQALRDAGFRNVQVIGNILVKAVK